MTLKQYKNKIYSELSGKTLKNDCFDYDVIYSKIYNNRICNTMKIRKGIHKSNNSKNKFKKMLLLSH